ncbi:hypothetical protein JXR93_04320 [bacterium]|nr:hypothetical protein [bacterium]
MATAETLENYLLQLGEPYEKIGESMWKINDEFDNIDDIVVFLSEPLVIFRVKLFDLPEGNKEELYRFMLELNAFEMTHGAYALEGNSVVIVDTLEAENLDYNEFEGSVSALALAIMEHYPLFKEKFFK